MAFSSSIPLPNIAATEKMAQQLAPHLRHGDMLALAGPLGAGKTTFARALLHALGIKDEVPSPTFTLLQTYAAKNFPVHHFDFYRLKTADELDELGWDDALADGVTIAEWPELAAGRMPKDRLALNFSAENNGARACRVEAHGAWNQRIKDIGL